MSAAKIAGNVADYSTLEGTISFVPARAPKTVGEIDSFITMLLVACENEMVNQRLESLLSLPDLRRQAEINAWVTDLLIAQAPRDFITAIACLLDNQVAEKAYEVIYKCKRGEPI